MNLHDLDIETAALVGTYGYEAVLAAAQKSMGDQSDCLTLISNGGLHVPPQEFLFGEIFYVTEGPITFTDIDQVEGLLDLKLKRLKQKLDERRWRKVYLLPFGHVVINMQIKMTVFRSLWIETIDIFYFGQGKYGLLERDSRNTLVK